MIVSWADALPVHRPITPYRDAFGFRARDRGSEVSTNSKPLPRLRPPPQVTECAPRTFAVVAGSPPGVEQRVHPSSPTHSPHRDAFGFRGRDRRSEVSAGAKPGRKAGTDRRFTVSTTVTEGIPEGFHPAQPERIATGGAGAKPEGIPPPYTFGIRSVLLIIKVPERTNRRDRGWRSQGPRVQAPP